MFETAVSHLQTLQTKLTPHAKLAIAGSGGMDSVALLHFLQAQVPAQQLVVAHLNHGLRETAVSHANFTQTLAASYQLPYRE